MFVDTYFDRLPDARAEASRRKLAPGGAEFVTKVEPSPYGGFRVRSVPADFYVDQLAEGVTPFHAGLSRRWPELVE